MNASENAGQTPVVAAQSTGTMRTSMFLPPLLPGVETGPQLPSALSAAPTAFTMWRAFVRRWPLALGSAIVLTALAVTAAFVLMPPRYPSYFWVKINAAKETGALTARTEDVDFQILKAFQSVLVKSRPVIHRTLETQVSGKYVKDFTLVREQTDPVEWLQGIKTDFHPQSPEVMRVTFATLEYPDELTQLMNALSRSLIEENRLLEQSKHNQLVEQTVARERDNAKLLDQKKQILVTLLGGRADDLSQMKKVERLEQSLRDTEHALQSKRLEIIAAENKLKSMRERMMNPDVASIPTIMLNEILKGDGQWMILSKEQEKAAQNLTDAQRVSSGPQLYDFIDRKFQADQAIESFKKANLPFITEKVREKLTLDARQEVPKLQDEAASCKQQEKLLEEAVRQFQADISRLLPAGGLPINVQNLRKEIDTLEEAQKQISKTIALMKADAPSSRVSILQDAIEPAGKDYSRLVKVGGAGGAGIFLLTILGISFMEFRARKICASEELSRGLGLALIGTVPALPARARGPLGQSDPYWQNQLMESVDTIRTMLLYGARSNNTRVILVSSAVGGEGKTSLASQLAASMARAWKKTLLIDGDLRSPAAHALFDVPQDPGLSEVLRGDVAAADAVRSTPLSRLWMMPAGHWDSHAIQALAQDGVRTMLEGLKQQYDFIIIDSSPLLPVADALLLGQHVDGVLLAVMRDVSRSPAVHAAQQRLEGLGIKTLGAVMIGARNELGPLGYKYVAQARP